MATFSGDTIGSKYQQLVEEHLEFTKDAGSKSKAQNLATNAWHLSDWVFQGTYPNGSTNQLGAFRAGLFPQCPELEILHDIANEHKHGKVSNPKSTIKLMEEVEGTFDYTFDFTFDKSDIVIEMADGTILEFEETIGKVMQFWGIYLRAYLP